MRSWSMAPITGPWLTRRGAARSMLAMTRTELGARGLVAVWLCGVTLGGCGDDGSGTGGSTSGGESTSEPGASTTTPTPTTGDGTSVGPTDPSTTTGPQPTTGVNETGDSSGTAPVCGDGNVDAGEDCDDENDSNQDACLNTCEAASCGDFFVQDGVEDCDDGNTDNFDGCTNTCVAATCSAGGATRGSAIAISPDDSRVVAVNRDAGTVTVFSVDYTDGLPALTVVDELDVGAEPWQVAIDPCGTTAYVVLRKDQKVVEIRNIHETPEIGGEVVVGSEPTALALTPNGTKLYVANWVDGTLSVIDPSDLSVTGTVDLNAALVGHPKKFLGDVMPRPALAHPRALAITGNGDDSDDDEKVYVTEYFAQRIAAEAGDGKNADVNHEGLVYAVNVSDDAVKVVELAPIADTTFADANMGVTGCYPNQLQSVTVNGGFAYVSSTCASPEGPIGFKNNTHPVVSVIDTATDMEVPAGTTNLTKNFTAQYGAKMTPDDKARRFPHVPNDIGFLPGSGVAYLAANGADAVFRVVYDQAAGTVMAVGNQMAPDFINLTPAELKGTPEQGQNPIGIAVANAQPFAFVNNDVTRNVSALDFAKQIVAGSDADDARVVPSSPMPMDPAEQSAARGKHFFNTGLGRWSLNGQAWGSCQACHVDGLTDNVTWYFGRGPRQSTSLDASYAEGDPTDQRIFNWTAVFDDMADFEGNTRGTSGGVGALVSFADPNMDPKNADRLDLASAMLFPPAGAAGLNGSAQEVTDDDSVIKDWNDIKTYIQTIRPPRAPSNLDPAMVMAGETIFQDLAQGGRCQGCHGGAKWTISQLFYTSSGATNAALSNAAWNGANLVLAGFPAMVLPSANPLNQKMRFGNAANDQIQCMLRAVGTFGTSPMGVGVAELRQDMTTPAQGNGMDSVGYNPPSLFGLGTGAPFFHAGNARTLEESLSSTFGTHWKSLTKNANFLSQNGDREKLVAYLLSIDADKPVVAIPAMAGDQGGDFCAAP